MKSEFKDFIGVFEDAIPNDVCERFINCFEGWKKHDMVFNRRQGEGISKHKKDDNAFAFSSQYCKKPNVLDEMLLSQEVIGDFNSYSQRFRNCFFEYNEEYSMVQEIPCCIYYSKIQKTIPGGGYHVWHCERDGMLGAARAFAFMVYLNDVEEGGETEFLYQKMRVTPKKGTVVIWPSDWTHTHRGNPPLSGDKYIYTGWLEYTSSQPMEQ